MGRRADREVVLKAERPISAQFEAATDNLLCKSVWVLDGDGWAYADRRDREVRGARQDAGQEEPGSHADAVQGRVRGVRLDGHQPGMHRRKSPRKWWLSEGTFGEAEPEGRASGCATVKAFNEAENYNGPAIIIAYAHCIEQGLATKTGPAHQKAAVESVHFPLWTYNPATGKVKLDSADKSDTVSFSKNAVSKELGENRFKQLIKKVGQEKAMAMLEKSEQGFKENYALLKKLSEM